MKGSNSSWITKTLTGRGSRQQTQDDSLHQAPFAAASSAPLAPGAYTDPRSAPKPPLPSKATYLNGTYRPANKASSTASLRSGYSDHSSAPSYPQQSQQQPQQQYQQQQHHHQSGQHHQQADAASITSSHPYGNSANMSGNFSHREEADDDRECPVCLESLSFSFRLPDEKPHITPECGHALHEACFTAVYGPVPNTRGNVPRNRNLGVCGVCRRPMKVVEGDSGGKSNKFAALTGMGDRDNPASTAMYPGRHVPIGGQGGRHTPIAKPYDPNEDDPLDHTGSVKGSSNNGSYVVAPSITVRPEFNTLTRTNDPTQPLTCIVVVELPSKRSPDSAPRIAPPESYGRSGTIRSNRSGATTSTTSRQQQQQQDQYQQFSPPNRALSPAISDMAPFSPQSANSQPQNHYQQQQQHQRGSDPRSPSMGDSSYMENNNSGTESDTAFDGPEEDEPDEPPSAAFAAITEDLRNRIIDWKNHPMSSLGPLQMYDMLRVRRDAIVREFFVYLFKEAIICVAEERRRTIGRLVQSVTGGSQNLSINSSGSEGADRPQSRGVLRLKGRIYIRHIRQVTDTSTAGELSLTIDMEDERLDSFILVFRDRSSLETWKRHVQRLVTLFQRTSPAARARAEQRAMQERAAQALDIEEFGGSAKAARMLSGATASSGGTANTGSSGVGHDSLLASSRSVSSSATSHSGMRQQNGMNGHMNGNGNMNGNMGQGMQNSKPQYGYQNQNNQQQQQQYQQQLSPLGEDEEMPSQYDPAGGFVTPHLSAGPSNALPPPPHAPIDLILVISVPPPHAPAALASLKLRVVKNALDFVLAQLGPRDRVSLVTFEMGAGGAVRKTPFLAAGRTQSRARLGKFVDEIGYRPEEGVNFVDEFAVRIQEEKTDVVTAINHGLDVVLQRKARNPVSGMILISDAADTTRRAQMDLVLARAEAANMPIHSFGYGRSHDPASLWLVSNNTGGTYTFVRDWYDLQACVAGCVGGMMSMGLLNMKLHLKAVDGSHFTFRKLSGGPNPILSSDGRHVDIDLGELRYGERKEMLVELELDNSDAHARQRQIEESRAAVDLSMGMGGMGGYGSMGGYGNGNGNGNGTARRNLTGTDQFVAQMGLDALAIGDSPDLADGMMDRMIDEVPVFEIDGAFFDPAAGRNVSRLAHPVLLTLTLLPPNSRAPVPRPPVGGSDPIIVRRRMEILTGDMITRALVLVSRKNPAQASTILGETRRVLGVVLHTSSAQLPPPGSQVHGGIRGRKEILLLAAVRCIQAMLQDLQVLTEALEENPDVFALDQRNFGAQQAMILRDQKSWSNRSAIERVFWTIDNSIELANRSADWTSRD